MAEDWPCLAAQGPLPAELETPVLNMDTVAGAEVRSGARKGHKQAPQTCDGIAKQQVHTTR